MDQKERQMHIHMLSLVRMSQELSKFFPESRLVAIHDEMQFNIPNTPENIELAQTIADRVKLGLNEMSDEELMAEVTRVRANFRANLEKELQGVENNGNFSSKN